MERRIGKTAFVAASVRAAARARVSTASRFVPLAIYASSSRSIFARLDACVLSGGGGVAAGNVIGNVTVEKFVKAMANRARRRNRMTGDFSDAYQIAVARGNENFLGRVEVFGAQRLFDNGKTGLRGDLQKDSARDAFEAPGVYRRR